MIIRWWSSLFSGLFLAFYAMTTWVQINSFSKQQYYFLGPMVAVEVKHFVLLMFWGFLVSMEYLFKALVLENVFNTKISWFWEIGFIWYIFVLLTSSPFESVAIVPLSSWGLDEMMGPQSEANFHRNNANFDYCIFYLLPILIIKNFYPWWFILFWSRVTHFL